MISKMNRFLVYERTQGVCVYCGCSIDMKTFHVDHIIPENRKRSNKPLNLAPSCRTCNTAKRDLLLTTEDGMQRMRLISSIRNSRVYGVISISQALTLISNGIDLKIEVSPMWFESEIPSMVDDAISAIGGV